MAISASLTGPLNDGFLLKNFTLAARRRSLFWRIHFWAALIASPFALIAALTGILYIFTPQVEQVLYGHLEQVVPVGAPLSLDDAVSAAQAAVPVGLALYSVNPSPTKADAVEVIFAPSANRSSNPASHSHGTASPTMPDKPVFGLPARSVAVYVNPYTGTVLGTQVIQERFAGWSKRLHSRLLQTDNWRWMIELAASWLMVMLVTGVWLWWPQKGAALLPQRHAKGRAAWKQWHAFLGVVLGVISLVILSTGLTWSQYAGTQMRAVRDGIGQAQPAMPRNLRSQPNNGIPMLQWQVAADITRELAPDVAYQLFAPRTPEGVWKASAIDAGQPTKRFDLVLDAYSGKPLYFSGWDKQTAFSKATGVGIPFHRGEFGWWNQLLLLIFGLGIVFSLVSGWVMTFARCRKGQLALPKMLPGAWRSPSALSWMVAIAMLAMMPLLALSAAMVLVIEIIIGMRGATRTV